jgi:hypothetical protein
MSERKVLFPNDILAVKTAKYQHRNYLTGLLDCGYGFGIQRQKPGGSQASYREGWIVESLNSGDYMDAAGIVKARRRKKYL